MFVKIKTFHRKKIVAVFALCMAAMLFLIGRLGYLMLPIVMEYNQDCTGEKYREIARAMGVKGVDDMSVEEYRKAAIDAVRKLSVDVGIPTKLEAIKEEDLDFLAESAHADACAPGNPKDASVEDLKDLFRKIM